MEVIQDAQKNIRKMSIIIKITIIVIKKEKVIHTKKEGWSHEIELYTELSTLSTGDKRVSRWITGCQVRKSVLCHLIKLWKSTGKADFRLDT